MTGRKPTPAWEVFARELGDNISAVRESKNLSQEHVAIAAGLSRHTYQRLERGLKSKTEPTNPTLYTLLSICQVLSVRIEDILPPAHPGLFSGHPAGEIAGAVYLGRGPMEPRPGHDIYGTRLT